MNTVILGFGRFQPVTKGHQKLVEKMEDISISKGVPYYIYTTHTHDKTKNPLLYEDKIHFLESAFGKDVVVESEARTIIEVLDEVREHFDDVILVVGEDRHSEFERILNRYAELNEGISVSVVSAGIRDPDSSDVEGISASLLREAVLEDDYETFSSMVPDNFSDEATEDMYSLMGESLLTEAVLDFRQRRKRAMDFKRRAPRIKLARERAEKRFATKDTLERRARKDAVEIVKNKLAGKKNYKDLSVGQKIMVDKRFESRKRVVDILARKLLPKVRKDEIARHIAAATKQGEDGQADEKKAVKESIISEKMMPDEKMLKRFRVIDKHNNEILGSFDTSSEALAFGKKHGGYERCKMVDTDKQ